MGKKPSVVEINGNRYDAVTGKLIGAVQQVASTSAQVIDGFTRRPARQVITPHKRPMPTRKPAGSVHQKTQRSITMMRSVVSRPQLKSAPKIDRPTARSRHTPISSSRLFRAKTVLRHPKIHHFSSRDQAKEGEVLPRSMALRANGGQTQALTRPLPSLAASLSHNQIERLLDHALARADAHKRALKASTRNPLKHFKRLPRWLNSLIVLVLAVAIGGFVLWQKVPEVSLKLAASRAHVDASTPAYIPAGYALISPVHYANGAVMMEIQSVSDKTKSLTITQQESDQDIDALKAATIPAAVPIQTSEANGSPMYIYGKHNNAVFKKGNTKVKIDNNTDLPPNELSNIAKSLN